MSEVEDESEINSISDAFTIHKETRGKAPVSLLPETPAKKATNCNASQRICACGMKTSSRVFGFVFARCSTVAKWICQVCAAARRDDIFLDAEH